MVFWTWKRQKSGTQTAVSGRAREEEDTQAAIVKEDWVMSRSTVIRGSGDSKLLELARSASPCGEAQVREKEDGRDVAEVARSRDREKKEGQRTDI